ncbi:hypothetical protein [Qipengyuania sp. DGS5-3]|uniref:hypothetical protein n=1 Tax=Qipengyuania sp. DGS5-3 TaxID=3349632 RepID=UPI0036D2714B
MKKLCAWGYSAPADRDERIWLESDALKVYGHTMLMRRAGPPQAPSRSASDEHG